MMRFVIQSASRPSYHMPSSLNGDIRNGHTTDKPSSGRTCHAHALIRLSAAAQEVACIAMTDPITTAPFPACLIALLAQFPGFWETVCSFAFPSASPTIPPPTAPATAANAQHLQNGRGGCSRCPPI